MLSRRPWGIVLPKEAFRFCLELAFYDWWGKPLEQIQIVDEIENGTGETYDQWRELTDIVESAAKKALRIPIARRPGFASGGHGGCSFEQANRVMSAAIVRTMYNDLFVIRWQWRETFLEMLRGSNPTRIESTEDMDRYADFPRLTFETIRAVLKYRPNREFVGYLLKRLEHFGEPHYDYSRFRDRGLRHM